MSSDDTQIDDLLARGSLGGPSYDAIFDRVMAEMAPDAKKSPVRLRWLFISGFLIPAALASLLYVRARSDAFKEKGPGGILASPVEIACADRPPSTCRAGSTLMFKVNTPVRSGYLGAYAERIDDLEHKRIWYFPTSSALSPFVPEGWAGTVLPQGILIGPEHLPGIYKVTIWVSDRALDRKEIVSAEAAHALRFFTMFLTITK